MKVMDMGQFSFEIIRTEDRNYKYIIHDAEENVVDWGQDPSYVVAKARLANALAKAAAEALS